MNCAANAPIWLSRLSNPRLAHRACAAGLLLALSGCTADLIRNQTAERQGDISVQFINTTPFRAAFSFGSYDSLERNPATAIFEQLLVEAQSTSASQTIGCRRIAAVGTQAFIDQVLRANADDVADFNPDAFSAEVNFSSAPLDSEAASLPTAGTARGREAQLGVEFSCGDRLIFTFVEDDTAEGGFRIDFSVVVDDEEDL